MTLNFAPGVTFDEAGHEYRYKGRRLSGVTGLIAQKLGLKMPAEFMEEHRIEGVHVHKSIQEWIDTGKTESVHPGVRWVTETLADSFKSASVEAYSEVLVSDFKRYASAVDIVARRVDAESLDIYDVKKGVFHRDYVSWQLGVYKYLIENATTYKVSRCVCICIRDKEYYPVFPRKVEDVEKLLYGSVA